jgi:hypothetical protein
MEGVTLFAPAVAFLESRENDPKDSNLFFRAGLSTPVVEIPRCARNDRLKVDPSLRSE